MDFTLIFIQPVFQSFCSNPKTYSNGLNSVCWRRALKSHSHSFGCNLLIEFTYLQRENFSDSERAGAVPVCQNECSCLSLEVQHIKQVSL